MTEESQGSNTDRDLSRQSDRHNDQQNSGRPNIDVSAVVHYVSTDSQPADNRYVFAYTMTITNRGELSAQLLDRHWIISNGDGEEHEVRGEGVIGEQPHIPPGSHYEYTSGAVLASEVGSMRGSYGFCTPTGERFEVAIDAFSLARPRAVH